MDKTAIVVDDDELVNDSLKELLEVLDIIVLGQGYNGEEAVELFSKYHPDYSFIDLTMPSFDGFFAIENIFNINTDSEIIVVTGDTSRETKKKLEKLGITKIIYKPYEIKDLQKVMKSN